MLLYDAVPDSRHEKPGQQRLQDHYKPLNPHLRAATLHARLPSRRDRPEPCGGDSDMD